MPQTIFLKLTFHQNFFSYIKMLKDSSARFYQKKRKASEKGS